MNSNLIGNFLKTTEFYCNFNDIFAYNRNFPAHPSGLCDNNLIRRVGESNYLTVRDTGRAPEACDEFGAEERHNEAVHIFQTTGRVILVI